MPAEPRIDTQPVCGAFGTASYLCGECPIMVRIAVSNQIERGLSEFRRYPPGERFQARFHRREGRRSGPTMRLLLMTGGILLALVGVLMLAMPGPGLLAFLIGVSVVAQESLTAARMLDWLELRIRAVGCRMLSRWQKSSQGARLMAVLSALAVLVVLGYGSYAALLGV